MHYSYKKQAHDLQESVHNYEQLQKDVSVITEKQKLKVDGDVMHDEIERTKLLIEDNL